MIYIQDDLTITPHEVRAENGTLLSMPVAEEAEPLIRRYLPFVRLITVGEGEERKVVDAQDDKEAVGHTMGLEEDQAKFLSNLAVGRAVVFNGNWPKAIQVQISQTFRTDAKIPKDENKILRSGALAFYAEDYKTRRFRHVASADEEAVGSGLGGERQERARTY